MLNGVKPAIKFTDTAERVADYIRSGRQIKRFARTRRGKRRPAAVVEPLNGIRER